MADEWSATSQAEPEYADPDLLAQVREAMANCEDNGFFDETVALGATGLRDDLMEKDGELGKADPDALLVAVRSYLAGLDLPNE